MGRDYTGMRMLGGLGQVRLLRLDIDEFRSIENQWVPADGLVVLFGPNSSGKTSVLEAVEQLITQAGTLRADPAGADGVV
jgi:recombinational DNA repair ATPase RecF